MKPRRTRCSCFSPVNVSTCRREVSRESVSGMISELVFEIIFFSQRSVTMLSQLFLIAKATCVSLQAKRYKFYLVRKIHQDVNISRNRKSCHVSHTMKTHKGTNSRNQKVRVQFTLNKGTMLQSGSPSVPISKKCHNIVAATMRGPTLGSVPLRYR